MPKIGLDDPQTDPCFEQMGCVTMSECVHSRMFLDVTFPHCSYKDELYSAGVHWSTRRFRWGSSWSLWRWKKPYWVPMLNPVLSQQFQCALEQWQVTILAPFPVPHVNAHPFTVNVGYLQR